ncbi:MAG TPA: DNA primase [Candidatus Subteraquimicrobiales bacterium]
MGGFIRDEDINEVRERNNIVEVISEYVPLKKAGKSFKALCPFHHEKTPSFTVDPNKQLYHCFGCGEGGSVFTFVMTMDKLDFPETVKTLADRVGYTLHFETSERAQKRTSFVNRLYDAYKESASFYAEVLRSERGKKALEYLKSRGFTEDTIREFQVGLAPAGWDSLLKFLFKKGFKPELLVRGGLLVQGENKSFYDRFRARIIFPIYDAKGRVIAFGGRALTQSSGRPEPKYLNSPETPLYHKSSILYGLFQAKNAMSTEDRALVVEGYTDVLALHQAGIGNAVATMGTAFTPEHLRLLNRFASTIELVFDGDTAGEAAAERGLDLLGESEAEIRVVSLPAGEDPADFVIKRGKEAFEKIIEKAEPLINFCLSQSLGKYDLEDPQGRAKAASETLSIVALLKSAIAQEEYLKKLAQKLNVSLDSLLLELKRLKSPFKKEPNKTFSFPMLDAGQKAEKELLGLVLRDPHEAKVLNQLDEEHFTFPDFKELFSILKSQLKTGEIEVERILTMDSSEKIQKNISKLMFEPLKVEDKENYVKDILAKIKVAKIERTVKKLKFELEGLNPASDPQRYDFIFRELLKLEQTKRDLNT